MKFARHFWAKKNRQRQKTFHSNTHHRCDTRAGDTHRCKPRDSWNSKWWQSKLRQANIAINQRVIHHDIDNISKDRSKRHNLWPSNAEEIVAHRFANESEATTRHHQLCILSLEQFKARLVMHPRETNRNQQKTCRKKNDDPRQHRKPNARPCISRRSRGLPCTNTLRNECVDETDGANKECDDRPRPDATIALRCKFKRSKLRDHDAVHELHQRVTGHRDDRRPCKRPDFAR